MKFKSSKLFVEMLYYRLKTILVFHDFEQLLIWWRCSRDEVYPWSPQVKDQDRANVHVYSINR